MQGAVQVEKDYGLEVDTVPQAAGTRPHAVVVLAKNMKAAGDCRGSLMIQIAFLIQCFSWIPKMKNFCNPVVH